MNQEFHRIAQRGQFGQFHDRSGDDAHIKKVLAQCFRPAHMENPPPLTDFQFIQSHNTGIFGAKFVNLRRFAIPRNGEEKSREFANFANMTEIIINGTADLPRAARVFLEHIGEHRILAFYGAMGAGKTSFITALCAELGVPDLVNSPTFTLVNEYRDGAGAPVFHFDFYRINRLSEALDIGLFEYFDSGALCLVEWPEMIEELLPDETLKIRILVEDAQTRTLLF